MSIKLRVGVETVIVASELLRVFDIARLARVGLSFVNYLAFAG